MPSIAIKKENKIDVTAFRVKYKDIFTLTDFYKDLHEWLKEYNWTDLEDKGDHYESFYLEKVSRGGAKEIWIKWRPQKVPQKNPYYRYWMDLNMHCIAVIPMEVVKDGKKIKTNKGEIDMNVSAIIELDYQGQWAKHSILKHFRNLFVNRIFRKELHEDHKRELYREAYELQNFIKRWFKLKRYLPYEETRSFYPSRAWPSHQK